jgi:hypothetical protein
MKKVNIRQQQFLFQKSEDPSKTSAKPASVKSSQNKSVQSHTPGRVPGSKFKSAVLAIIVAAAMFIGLILLLSGIAWGSPLPDGGEAAPVAQPSILEENSTPQPPSRSEQGESVGENGDNLPSPPEAIAPESRPETKSPPSAGPYDMDEIQKFNRSLYGS